MSDLEAAIPENLEPLRAQDTLEELVVRDRKVSNRSGSQTYPVRGGLIFMGYAADDEDMIRETTQEERAWQGTPEAARGSEAFLDVSAPHAVDLVNLIRTHTGGRPGLRSLELGSGSGWVSFLMAKAGFDTYICDFEANSLASGWIYEHPSLGPGRRIVADARYPPFANESFDIVFLKEFAHHVQDVRGLFAEVNRVLRPGGVVALMEPTRSVWSTLYRLRHPDPHQGHHMRFPDRYLYELRRSGFRRRALSVVYPHPRRRKVVRALQDAAARSAAGQNGTPGALAAIHLRLLGGGSIMYLGEKVRRISPRARPRFAPIDPSTLTLTAADREAWSGCLQRVERAAERLS